MCIITKQADVSHTRIFARVDGDQQVIVYQNKITAWEPAAMVLPIPEATSEENAVEFIDLEKHEELFNTLKYRFASQWTLGARARKSARSFEFDTLKVEDVGSFKASYVPSQDDFKRLDKRFRLAPKVWELLPQYEDFGFVVFQFKAGPHEPHPMAFRFKTRHPEAVYMPTVHVHDEEVHPEGDFDHVLYIQTKSGQPHWATSVEDLPGGIVTGNELSDSWEAEAEMPAEERARTLGQFERTGIFNSDILWRKAVKGRLPNKDLYVRVS